MVPSDPFAHLNALARKLNWPVLFDPGLAFEREELRGLLELWRAKAGDGVPPRTVFDMRSLKPYVTHILILERQGSGEARRYRFRLFGSAHLQLFGEHTGHYLDEMVSAGLLPSWLALYDSVLAARRPLRAVVHFRMPSENFLRGEIFAAPVSNSAGAVEMILAATYVGTKNVVPSPFG